MLVVSLIAMSTASLVSPARAGETVDRILGNGLLSAGISAALARGPHEKARPTEEIPRGSWIMDALAGLALRGVIPYSSDYFRGNYSLTRGDVAAILLRALTASPPTAAPVGAPPVSATPSATAPGLPPVPQSAPGEPPAIGVPQSARLRLLAWEFRYELAQMGLIVPDDSRPQNLKPMYGLYVRGQLGDFDGNIHPRALGAGDVEGAIDGAQYTVSVSNLNPGGFDRPFELSAPVPGPITGVSGLLRYNPDSLYLRGVNRLAIWKSFSGWRVEAGRDWLQWGPEYSGGLLLSDNTGPLDMVHVTKNFDMGRFGTWRFQQFTAYDHEPGVERYLLGRRIEKTLKPGLDAAASEALVSIGAPPAYTLVLPFYLAERINGGKANKVSTDTESYLIDFQLAYRNRDLKRYYGDILIDEITFPVPFAGQQYRPRKAGFLAGMDLPHPRPGIDNLTLEAVYTDAKNFMGRDDSTYLHQKPTLAYARYGGIIGNPIGPGSSGLVARADFKPKRDWRYFLQATVEQHHRIDANPDVEAAGWVGGSRRIGPGRTFSLTLRPYWAQHPDNLPDGSGVHLDAQAYFSAQF
ncbi:MAG TPA: capsule assembly Wzi family protein [Armatimonadota bacterium]|nr:capsule assembly Wzi family protein [Armatimonadota bacterium]